MSAFGSSTVVCVSSLFYDLTFEGCAFEPLRHFSQDISKFKKSSTWRPPKNRLRRLRPHLSTQQLMERLLMICLLDVLDLQSRTQGAVLFVLSNAGAFEHPPLVEVELDTITFCNTICACAKGQAWIKVSLTIGSCLVDRAIWVGCWTKNMGKPSQIMNFNRGFHCKYYKLHPFWGLNTPIFGYTHIHIYRKIHPISVRTSSTWHPDSNTSTSTDHLCGLKNPYGHKDTPPRKFKSLPLKSYPPWN